MSWLVLVVKWIDALNHRMGTAVSWLTLVMALVTFVIVILRYWFNVGWIWMQESVMFMHGFLFMLAGGYTLLHNEHVRVDIFYQVWSAQFKAWANLLGTLFLLFPLCALIAYYGFIYVSASWEVLEGSREAGGLDGVFLLKSAILAFPCLIGLQGISQLGHAVLILLNHPLKFSQNHAPRGEPPVL